MLLLLQYGINLCHQWIILQIYSTDSYGFIV